MLHPRSGEYLQSVFLHYRQELERHAAGFLGSRLPLLHRRFTRIQIAGKDRLADVQALTERLDLVRCNRGWRDETGYIKAPHSRLVDSSSSIHTRDAAVDGLKSIGFVFAILSHGISPSVLCIAFPWQYRPLFFGHTYPLAAGNLPTLRPQCWPDLAWQKGRHISNTAHPWRR